MKVVPDDASVLADLWGRFKESGSKDLRDRLILHYAPIVKFVAGRVATRLPNTVEQTDLISYGIFGLVDAIEKFDPVRGNKFETYAISRIRGAIIDELRHLDWVPRSVRAKARAIEQASAKLEHELHRFPTDEELVSAMGISTAQLQQTLLEISRTGVCALDELVSGAGDDGDGTVTLGDTLAEQDGGPVELFELDEIKRVLGEAVAAMPERERLVLTLYYYENLTLAEIGQVLGVTESRVSQIHTKGILQLRVRFLARERGLAG
ncbi:MAG: FliA/WhiG family RNA polymerase sigma factor [Acidimicrobiia bacterium]